MHIVPGGVWTGVSEGHHVIVHANRKRTFFFHPRFGFNDLKLEKTQSAHSTEKVCSTRVRSGLSTTENYANQNKVTNQTTMSQSVTGILLILSSRIFNYFNISSSHLPSQDANGQWVWDVVWHYGGKVELIIICVNNVSLDGPYATVAEIVRSVLCSCGRK